MIIATLLLLALSGKPTNIEVEPFSGIDSDGMEVGCMRLTSGVTLRGPKGFGGYSGMDFDAESGALTLLSDAGHLFTAKLNVSDSGRIETLTGGSRSKIVRPGNPKSRNDTEGLARLGGDWLVTREHDHDAVRVQLTDGQYLQSEQLTDFSAIGTFPPNKSFEAVAAIGDGGFLLIPEHHDKAWQTPVIQWKPRKEPRTIATYQGEKDFHVTDMTTDDSGERLFIVERAFSRMAGPRAKIKAVRINQVLGTEADQIIEPETLGRLTLFHGVDNMEGLAYFKAKDGSENLLVVSDDNYNSTQRTVLMTLRLSGICPLATTQP